MRLLQKVTTILAILCGTQLVFSTPANASGVILVSTDMLALFQTVSAANQCISYQYDRNGNLIAKISSTFGAAPTWGSSSFGCFSWSS